MFDAPSYWFVLLTAVLALHFALKEGVLYVPKPQSTIQTNNFKVFCSVFLLLNRGGGTLICEIHNIYYF